MIVDLQQNTPEWLEFRRNKIGASDAAAIMGVSPWTTPYQLWQKKLGLVGEKEKSFAMKRGSDLENEALNCFNAEMGLSLHPQVVKFRCYDWMIASLDGFDGSIAVEIKCPNKEDHTTAIKGMVPKKYMPQLQHQMMCAELHSMWYYSFDGTHGAAVKVVADKEYQQQMLEKEIEFYKCMKEFIPPTMTEKDYIQRNDLHFLSLCEQYKAARMEMKKWQEKEKLLREELIQEVGGCNSIANGIKLTKSIRKGLVNYSIIPELGEVNLDMYRSDPVISWKITMGEHYE